MVDYEYNYTFYNANNVKDDVRDSFFVVSPNDTPLLAMLEVRPVYSKVFEWLMEDIAQPTSKRSGEAEGAINATEITGTRPRVLGVIQKLTNTFGVTETDRATQKYGLADEYFYKAQKAFLLLAKDFETSLHWGQYNAFDGGTTTTDTEMAGLIQWLALTGAHRDQGDSSATIAGNSSFPSTYFSTWHDCVAKSTGILSEDTFNSRIQAAWEIGTSISDCVGLCGGDVKRRISQFNLVYNQGGGNINTGVGTELYESINRTMQKEMKTRQVSMDYYESDFGAFPILLDRYMNSNFSYDTGEGGTSATSSDDFIVGGDDTIVFFDPSYFRLATLRPFQTIDLAKTLDAQTGYVVAELGLEVGNPKAGFGISRVDNAA